MFGTSAIVGEKVVSALKGRIVLPSFTGAEVGDEVSAQYDFKKTKLCLYSRAEFERRLLDFQIKLNEAKSSGKIDYEHFQRLKRYYYGVLSFMPETVDIQRRLHLEKRVYEDLQLGNKVFVVGVKNHLEVFPSFEAYDDSLVTVYRVSLEKEINEMLSNNRIVGKEFDLTSANTHQYEAGVSYIHFFKNKKDILRLSSVPGYYVCIYRIPSYLLEKYEGVGFYPNIYNFSGREAVEEYAIPASELNITYLQSVLKIKDFIDIDEYNDDETLEKYTEKVYVKKLIFK